MINRIFEWLTSRLKEQISDEEALGTYDTEAVLVIVSQQFHGNSKVGVEIGSTNERTIAEDRALIAKYRDWLKTQPRKVAKAHEYWLRYYERGCNKAEKAIAGNAWQKFHDHWERDVAAKIHAAQERAKTYPKLDRGQ